MILQVGVKIFLRNSEGKYLLLLRSSDKYIDGSGGLWDIPGGRIDTGSSLFDNLKREVMEETSLILDEVPELIGAQDIIRPPERHVVRLTYVANIQGEPILDGEEHVEYKWFTLDEMNALEGLDPFSKELLGELNT